MQLGAVLIVHTVLRIGGVSTWADTAGQVSALSVVSGRLNATEIAPYVECVVVYYTYITVIDDNMWVCGNQRAVGRARQMPISNGNRTWQLVTVADKKIR